MDRPILEGAGTRLKTHAIHIENRELMSITGIKEVISFNDVEIVLMTDLGKLRIEGNDLRITKLNVDDGNVIIEGQIIALEYEETTMQKGGLFSRVFR